MILSFSSFVFSSFDFCSMDNIIFLFSSSNKDVLLWISLDSVFIFVFVSCIFSIILSILLFIFSIINFCWFVKLLLFPELCAFMFSSNLTLKVFNFSKIFSFIPETAFFKLFSVLFIISLIFLLELSSISSSFSSFIEFILFNSPVSSIIKILFLLELFILSFFSWFCLLFKCSLISLISLLIFKKFFSKSKKYFCNSSSIPSLIKLSNSSSSICA